VRERGAAGRYLIDKLLPTITRVEEAPTSMAAEAIFSIRDSLATLASLPPPQPIDSRSIYKGVDALPKAIDVEIVGTSVETKTP
jgi:hypothetical protein